MTHIVFSTERLDVRTAKDDDTEMFYTLWKDPRVMTNVGFPEGLPITREEIAANIAKKGDGEFEQYLVVERKSDGEILGECKLQRPDAEGIAGTDVKLLPEFWGNRFGVEVKQGLLDYLFTHTDCVAVQADPNQKNGASIRMQESVGGVRVAEGIHRFPSDTPGVTEDVVCYIYHVFRETWEERRANPGGESRS